jgi:hypothetical protein
MVTENPTREPEILPPETPPDYDALLFLLMVELTAIAVLTERLLQNDGGL